MPGSAAAREATAEMRRTMVVVWVLAGGVLGAQPVFAHPLAPSVLDVREDAADRARVSWRQPVAAPANVVQPVLPAPCRPVGKPALRTDDVARVLDVTIACDGGLIGATFGVSGLAGSPANVLLRVALRDGRVVHHVFRPGDASFRVPERPHAIEIVASYLRLGVEHIAGGADHLLFLLGLVALAPTWRRLAGTVTAFTAGHAATLSAVTLGHVSLPSAPVEALIALTILVLAWELARGPQGAPTLLQRRPWTLTVACGALHGLGFAGALSEVGLPDREIPQALAGFNVGVEAGQLAFVVGIAVLSRPLAVRLAGWRHRRLALAYAIGSIAACLLLERTALLGTVM